MIYRTCGLKIRSTLELPELPRVQNVGRNANPPMPRNWWSIGRSPEGVEVVNLCWARVGRFRVTDRSITIFRASAAKDDLVRTYLLGPALGVLLHLRQMLVLHSSSVEIGGKAVAFAGKSGSGKSTIAFALSQRGHRILSDDLLVLKRGHDRWTALSGPCVPKLWPKAARLLGAGNSQFERIHSWTSKRMARPDIAVASCARPLGCIYTLALGRSPRIEKRPSRHQFRSLLRNAYCRTLANANDAIFYFMQCTQLVRDVPVRELCRTRNPDGIKDFVELIERDQEKMQCHASADD